MNYELQLLLPPIAACLLLPPLLIYYGLHIVRRGIIFVDLALAQVATLGTCLCIMLGHDPLDMHTYLWSLGFTFFGAFIFTMTRNTENHRVPQEALIGIVYVVAAAASVLLLSRTTEGREELQKTLVGDVLTVSWPQIWKTFGLYAAIGVVHFIFRRQFIGISFDPDKARSQGVAIRLWDFMFYALFGLVVTSFVQIGGVLLVFSYLIVPAVCAVLLTRALRWMLVVGWTVATFSGVIGIYGSYKNDLPMGAAIVCVLGFFLVLALIIAAIIRRKAGSMEKKI